MNAISLMPLEKVLAQSERSPLEAQMKPQLQGKQLGMYHYWDYRAKRKRNGSQVATCADTFAGTESSQNRTERPSKIAEKETAEQRLQRLDKHITYLLMISNL